MSRNLADGELRMVRAEQLVKPGWADRFHDAMRRKKGGNNMRISDVMFAAIAFAAFAVFPTAAFSHKAAAVEEDEPKDWSVSTTTTPRGVVKSVDAMASGVYGEGRDFDIIFIRMICSNGVVQLSMSRYTTDKSRIIEATFYKGYETAEQQKFRTYWRSDDGQEDLVYDGLPQELLSRIGDGPFDVLVADQSGSMKLYYFDVMDSSLALSRVKAECKAA